MKKHKSLLAFTIMAVMLSSIASCSSSNSDSKRKKKHDKKNPDKIEVSVESQDSSEVTESTLIANGNVDGDVAGNIDNSGEAGESVGQAYYNYVAYTLVPQIGLSDIDNSLIMAIGSDNYYQQAEFQPKFGLLSADVRDYNGDGKLDLVTFSLSDMPSSSTSTGVVMADRWNGYAGNYLSVTARFYTFESGGDVVLKSQVDSITELSGNSIGTLIYGVYNDEGTVYIYGFCNTETPETYGPRKTNIYHVEGESFVFDATQGFYGFGQASVEGDPNVIAGTAGVDFAPTATGTALTHVSANVFTDPSAECSGSVLGGVKVGYYETMDKVQVELYDLSLLRDVINNGIEVLESRPAMPVFEAPVNIIPEDEANALISRLSESSGVAINYSNLNLIDGGGSLFVYVTDSGVKVKIRYSAEGTLEVLDILYGSASPCEDWYAIKDAAFTDSVLAINPSLYETFLGHCEWNQTSTSDDKVSVIVARMDDCFCTISFS